MMEPRHLKVPFKEEYSLGGLYIPKSIDGGCACGWMDTFKPRTQGNMPGAPKSKPKRLDAEPFGEQASKHPGRMRRHCQNYYTKCVASRNYPRSQTKFILTLPLHHERRKVCIYIREALERCDDTDIAIRADNNDRALLLVDAIRIVPAATRTHKHIRIVEQHMGPVRSEQRRQVWNRNCPAVSTTSKCKKGSGEGGEPGAPV